jgi:hypothetical protein
MTQEQFDALVTGDIVIRVSTGKRYVVSMTNRGTTPGANLVRVQIVKDGKGFGRGYSNWPLAEFVVEGQDGK